MAAPTSGLLRQCRCHSPVGVGVGAKRAALVDAGPAGLGIGLGRGHGAGAALAQLGQGHPAGRLQQGVHGPGINARGRGDGRGGLGRELAPAGGGRRLGQGLEPAGGVDGRRRLDHGGAGAPGQVMGRRSVALGPPPTRLGHTGRSQGLDGRGDPLDARRLVHHPLRVGRAEQGRVETGGVVSHRPPQLVAHAHGRALRPTD